MVTRYVWNEDGMCGCSEGDYVEYEDYAALEDRVAELERDADRYRHIADQHSSAWEDELDAEMESLSTDTRLDTIDIARREAQDLHWVGVIP